MTASLPLRYNLCRDGVRKTNTKLKCLEEELERQEARSIRGCDLGCNIGPCDVRVKYSTPSAPDEEHGNRHLCLGRVATLILREVVCILLLGMHFH